MLLDNRENIVVVNRNTESTKIVKQSSCTVQKCVVYNSFYKKCDRKVCLADVIEFITHKLKFNQKFYNRFSIVLM